MSPFKLTPYTAVGLAEGFVEGTEEEVLAAWQYIEDNGLAVNLQGAFGRKLEELKNAGLVTTKKEENQ